MSPSDAIAMLDRQIAAHGQRVVFRRGQGTPVATTGFVRGYQAEQLIGLITQADRNVTVSPTGLGTFVPAPQDQVSLDGAVGVVQYAEPVRMGTVNVRYNVRVRMS